MTFLVTKQYNVSILLALSSNTVCADLACPADRIMVPQVTVS